MKWYLDPNSILRECHLCGSKHPRNYKLRSRSDPSIPAVLGIHTTLRNNVTLFGVQHFEPFLATQFSNCSDIADLPAH
jgi:hypothetical protein